MEESKVVWDLLEFQEEGNIGFRFKVGVGDEVGVIRLEFLVEFLEQRRGYRENKILVDVYKVESYGIWIWNNEEDRNGESIEEGCRRVYLFDFFVF